MVTRGYAGLSLVNEFCKSNSKVFGSDFLGDLISRGGAGSTSFF